MFSANFSPAVLLVGLVACSAAAAYGDKAFVGTLDGRLIALRAADGTVAWSQQTTDTTAQWHPMS